MELTTGTDQMNLKKPGATELELQVRIEALLLEMLEFGVTDPAVQTKCLRTAVFLQQAAIAFDKKDLDQQPSTSHDDNLSG